MAENTENLENSDPETTSDQENQENSETQALAETPGTSAELTSESDQKTAKKTDQKADQKSPKKSSKPPKNAKPQADHTNDYTFKLNHARNLVQQAAKAKKIFCIQGCYPVIRYMLKNRGWLERDWKHFNVGSTYQADPITPRKGKNKGDKEKEVVDSESDDDDNDNTSDFKQLDKDLIGYEKSLCQIENNSIDALCGRMLKDEPMDKCSFYWMIRTSGMNIREMTGRSQMINHFPNSSYCTKSGIMDLLNNHLHWATDTLPSEFFPRCYKLSNPDELHEFLTDYKLSVAICILRIFLKQKFGDNEMFSDQSPRNTPGNTPGNTPRESTTDFSQNSTPKVTPRTDSKTGLKSTSKTTSRATTKSGPKSTPNSPRTSTLFTPRMGTRKRQRNRETIPSSVLDKAIETITSAIESIKEDTHSNYENGTIEEEPSRKIQPANEDGISLTNEGSSIASKKCEKEISEEDRSWYNNYYKLAYNDANFEPGTYSKFNSTEIRNLLESSNIHLKKYQSEILNSHNLWIVKPGAKSRGRGIQVQSKILEILRSYVGVGEPNLQKDGRWIIQKYIERPLLVYDTKFDIRQWFLIDNWSPLKIWMFKDSYLRFSGRKFSLTNHSQAIHLCNHSIQKNIESQDPKGGFGMDTSKLPEDNMWTNHVFSKWYQEKYGVDDIWQTEIWPQMLEITKKVMLTALESGNMEAAGRMRGSFELYGADFMITMNCGVPKVWLVEINSSPTMALNSSAATNKLCREVLEDTVNLVLNENRWNSVIGCKIGKFELGYVHNTGQKLPSYSGEKMECVAVQVKKPRERKLIRTFRVPGDHTALRKRDGNLNGFLSGDVKTGNDDDVIDEVDLEKCDTDKSENEVKNAEIEAKTFSRKLTLRKVSALKSPENSNDSTQSIKNSDLISNFSTDLIPNLTPRTRRKQLPKLERRPLMQREHKPKNSELPEKIDRKPYIRKMPKRTYRTPMSISVCSSQTTLTPVGSKATETRVFSNKKGAIGDVNENLMKSAKQQINSLPFSIKSKTAKNNNYLTSEIQELLQDKITENITDQINGILTDKINESQRLTETQINQLTKQINNQNKPNSKLTEKLTEELNEKLTDKMSNQISENNSCSLDSSADINYSVLVNGKTPPKRIKPFTSGDYNDKHAKTMYHSETKLRSIASLNSLINPTKIAKQLSTNAKQNYTSNLGNSNYTSNLGSNYNSNHTSNYTSNYTSKQNSNKQYQPKQFQNNNMNKQFFQSSKIPSSKNFQSSKNIQNSINSKEFSNSNQQKTVSVVDMSSWLHRGSSYNRKTYHNFKVKHATSSNLWHPNQYL